MNEIYLKGIAKLLEWGMIIFFASLLFVTGLFTGWLIWG